MSRIQPDNVVQHLSRLLGAGVGRTALGEGKVVGLRPQPLPYELPPVVADTPDPARAAAIDTFVVSKPRQEPLTYSRPSLVDVPARDRQASDPAAAQKVSAALREPVSPNPSLPSPSPTRFACE
ncbi:hypothetical protein [Aquabacterium humicola]|uniref:hypothetical protein n=1 Tax=Aquabacterium humicola TaxID=3237377 RepID=UPI002543F749|nr:hypothetical protein [Rubrivivax pictus]